MKAYWPCAETTTTPLWTYDSALTINKCMDAFKCWKNDYGYTLTKAWIDVYEDGIRIERIDVEINKI